MTGVARTTTQAPTVSGGRPPGGGWHPRMRGREPGGEQRDHPRRWPRNGQVRALGGGGGSAPFTQRTWTLPGASKAAGWGLAVQALPRARPDPITPPGRRKGHGGDLTCPDGGGGGGSPACRGGPCGRRWDASAWRERQARGRRWRYLVGARAPGAGRRSTRRSSLRATSTRRRPPPRGGRGSPSTVGAWAGG